MPNLAVNRITNANVYLDGIGLLGRAEEIEVAKPKHKMVDHKGLGMAGTAEFWAGVDKLEAKIKWASIYPEAETALNSPFEAHYFQVRSNLETYTSQGRTQQQPLVYLMTGIFKDAGAMNFKLHEGVDTTSVISVYHSELYIGGTQIFLFDVMANIYVVNGVDQLDLPRQPWRIAVLSDYATRAGLSGALERSITARRRRSSWPKHSHPNNPNNSHSLRNRAA